MRILIALAALLSFSLAHAASLDDILSAPHRSSEEKARDQYRHPVQTLNFFEVEKDMTVVEIWPGAKGWYTAILAPYLREEGTFYAAQFPPDSDIDFYTRALALFKANLAKHPALYDRTRITHLYPPAYSDIAPANTVDRVLTFRNVHNWAKAGKAEAVFASFFKALKPGGILGVVEHRALIPASRTSMSCDHFLRSPDIFPCLYRQAAVREGASRRLRDGLHCPGDWHSFPIVLRDENRLFLPEQSHRKFVKPE